MRDGYASIGGSVDVVIGAVRGLCNSGTDHGQRLEVVDLVEREYDPSFHIFI